MYTYEVKDTKLIINVELDDKEWNDGVNQAYETSKSKFNVVGFRKGHAPKKVIEQQYGDDVFYEDALGFFMKKIVGEIIAKDHKLEPVSYPNIKIDGYIVGNGIKFAIEYEILPDFELPKYTGLEFEQENPEVTDEDINFEIDQLLEDNVKYNIVDRNSKVGDEVIIDFVGSVDGVEFEGGKAMDYPLELGSHTFIDTFEDQLVGKKKGDSVDVNVKFPDDYQSKDLAGKKALFKTTIKEVREKILPELNDKFVADATEFETLEEYKKHLTEHIQSIKKERVVEHLKNDIVRHIVTNTEIKIPQSFIDEEVHQNVHQLNDMCKVYNIELEDYLSRMDTTLDEYKASCAKRAVDSIKIRYILRKIIEENKISASAKEIEEEIQKTPELSSKKELTNDDKLYAEDKVLLNKALNFLVDNNKIIVKK